MSGSICNVCITVYTIPGCGNSEYTCSYCNGYCYSCNTCQQNNEGTTVCATQQTYNKNISICTSNKEYISYENSWAPIINAINEIYDYEHGENMHGDSTITSRITNTGEQNAKITLSLYNEARSRLNTSSISGTNPKILGSYFADLTDALRTNQFSSNLCENCNACNNCDSSCNNCNSGDGPWSCSSCVNDQTPCLGCNNYVCSSEQTKCITNNSCGGAVSCLM